jgi:hypothetical protein
MMDFGFWVLDDFGCWVLGVKREGGLSRLKMIEVRSQL